MVDDFDMDFEDKEIACVDCGREFTWSANDQQFYEEKQLSAPKRCKECRIKKKQKRGEY